MSNSLTELVNIIWDFEIISLIISLFSSEDTTLISATLYCSSLDSVHILCTLLSNFIHSTSRFLGIALYGKLSFYCRLVLEAAGWIMLSAATIYYQNGKIFSLGQDPRHKKQGDTCIDSFNRIRQITGEIILGHS